MDDDENILWAVNALLSMKGYDVDVSKTATDALKKAAAKTYNLAIIDIKLPDMNGVTLLGKLRVSQPHMRKIIMTGFATKDNAIKALNYGADMFLTKPVDLNQFVSAIEDQLEKQSGQQRISAPGKQAKPKAEGETLKPKGRSRPARKNKTKKS